ncbi:hypothetical protein F5Y17DRAFT_476005 [Xylariaceae sp. FL0594]|nr:hypothetical protein F5Y17DRAFT_476005 [Xylariaceae sp. FL0594]
MESNITQEGATAPPPPLPPPLPAWNPAGYKTNQTALLLLDFQHPVVPALPSSINAAKRLLAQAREYDMHTLHCNTSWTREPYPRCYLNKPGNPWNHHETTDKSAIENRTFEYSIADGTHAALTEPGSFAKHETIHRRRPHQFSAFRGNMVSSHHIVATYTDRYFCHIRTELNLRHLIIVGTRVQSAVYATVMEALAEEWVVTVCMVNEVDVAPPYTETAAFFSALGNLAVVSTEEQILQYMKDNYATGVANRSTQLE